MRRPTSSQSGIGQAGHPIRSITDFLSHTRNTLLETQEQIQRAADVLAEGQKLLDSTTAAGSIGAPPVAQVSPASGAFPAAPVPQPEGSTNTFDESAGGQSAGPLRIYTLGQFRVCRGNREVDRWRSNKAKGILKLLVTHLGRPLPKDIFVEALWPDQPAQPANSSFRVAMHQLRQTLGQLEDSSSACEYLSSDGTNHFLDCDNSDIPVWVAIAEFILAEELYRGDFLEEDIYEDWSIIRREALVDVYLSLLGKVSAFYLKSSDYESCIEVCQKLLDRDCCREDAYQSLMFCYGKLGQRSRAVRWFELCQEAMRRELECDVSRETIDLYRRINDGVGF